MAELPPEGPQYVEGEEAEPVLVGKVEGVGAVLFAQLLQEAGIRCWLRRSGDGVAVAIGGASRAPSGVYVSPRDVGRARVLYRAFLQK